MNIFILFNKEISKILKKEKINILSDKPMCEIRGLSIKKGNRIFINLNAIQWKKLTENMFINELSKTITHELTHLYCSENEPLRPLKYEEEVCKIMAGQI